MKHRVIRGEREAPKTGNLVLCTALQSSAEGQRGGETETAGQAAEKQMSSCGRRGSSLFNKLAFFFILRKKEPDNVTEGFISLNNAFHFTRNCPRGCHNVLN